MVLLLGILRGGLTFSSLCFQQAKASHGRLVLRVNPERLFKLPLSLGENPARSQGQTQIGMGGSELGVVLDCLPQQFNGPVIVAPPAIECAEVVLCLGKRGIERYRRFEFILRLIEPAFSHIKSSQLVMGFCHVRPQLDRLFKFLLLPLPVAKLRQGQREVIVHAGIFRINFDGLAVGF